VGVWHVDGGNTIAVSASVNDMADPTDTPIGGGPLRNFMSLFNNPVRRGYATFAIGLVKNDRVKIQIFDVAGRLVRMVADRNFAAGEHHLIWDGVDQTGTRAARGVYFAKVAYQGQGFMDAGKLVILK
jgi:hypothetical protein